MLVTPESPLWHYDPYTTHTKIKQQKWLENRSCIQTTKVMKIHRKACQN